MAEKNMNQKMSRTDHAKMATENRKLRNRLSQKAFRARQAMRIKELEERLDSRPLSETGRVAELEDRNMLLRDQLLDCHKKLESLQVTLKALADSTASALGMLTSSGACQEQNASNGKDKPAPHGERLVMSDPPDPVSHNYIDQSTSQEDTMLDPGVVHKEITMDGCYLGMEDPDTSQIEFLNSHDVGASDTQQRASISSDLNTDFFDPDNFLSNDGPQSNDLAVFCKNGSYNSPMSQLPLSFSFSQMGPAAYADVAAKGPLLVRGPHGQLHRTNSLFSDHITVVEHFLRQKWLNAGALLNRGDECLASSVSFMLSAFVCMSWQTMTAWHTYTRAHVPVGQLMTWHLNPTNASYMKIAACYRPTQLQLTVPHPAIIDWIPWPAMRDKLILCHSANPCLDDIVCEIGNSYVVEGDLSQLVAGIRPMMGFVGVWDMVKAISPEATGSISGPSQSCAEVWNGAIDPDFSSDGDSPQGSIEDSDENMDQTCVLPAPNVSALFNSKAFALQAFKLLGMDKGAVTFRLDPAFFEKHPELYDYKANLMAHGVPLRLPDRRRSVPVPRPLDSIILGRYRELTTWTFDLSLGGPCYHAYVHCVS